LAAFSTVFGSARAIEGWPSHAAGEPTVADCPQRRETSNDDSTYYCFAHELTFEYFVGFGAWPVV